MANIKVAIRVRPISEREVHFTGSEIVVHTEEKAISLTNLKVSSSKAGDSRERTRKYGFDYCFDSSDPRADKYASQSKIYEALGESILEVLFNGLNSCLVAYGQSASGKTYTMMGSKEDPGLTPRICEGLFLRLANNEKSDTNFDVSVSYLEVYNERVRDLLRPSASSLGLRVREHPRLGPYVQGLTHHPVSTLGSLISRVEEGTRARKTASTLQNPTSSRSHALLTVSLRPSSNNIGQSATDASRNVPSTSERFQGGSKLHLVDLAGSESAAACGGVNRLKEGANINKSLVALGNVISALAERGSSGSGPGRRFIPYRDSALTWLLKDALGGNATTIMLATISPASGSYNETSHTLRFAQRAQSVVNRPVINEDPVSRTIRELRAEVSRLKSLLVEKSVDPDCKSICTCQHVREQESKIQDHEARVFDRNGPDEGNLRDEADRETSTEEIHLRISERRHSTSESLLPRNELSGLVRRFGSFDIALESRKLSLDSIEPDSYNRAKVSELIIDDHIEEPVFVDIPTLVAVLIKPDDNVHVGGHQIEEITSDGIPEDVTGPEFSENVADHRLPPSNELNHSESGETPIIQCSEVHHDPTESQENQQPSVEARIDQRVNGKLEKHDSIDGERSAKKSVGLQSSKKYGSIENLPRKREIAWSFQRSQTNLDKRNGSLDRIKKLNNIKEIEDRGTVRSAASWRNLGPWEGRDLQRKGSNDSDKSLKESALLARSKNQVRKQSIDGLKRKTSKDSSSSSSKDELSANSGGQTHEGTSRKGSLEQEQPLTRAHTPIQRARRAEIVAAVTERLYSAKKLSEDATALTGTTASTPTSEVRSPESTDVKLATSTRMRLQEISRKMLAKRRRVCVDTQTDNHQTVRVRDASSITEEPKIISKDASVLTDQHEDYEIPTSVEYPVRRVKEIATCTDSDLRQPIVRCKDAANLTDDYYDDYATPHSPRNDSGIMSDDAQNYAESNLSSAEMSDLSPVGGGRSVELVENSTNTGIPTVSLNSGSQTRSEDLERAARCSDCDARFCGRHHCRGDCGLNLSDANDVRRHTERNVISISLPEMMNITIETSNGMESKIKVFDGNESIDERAMINLKDGMAQTERRDVLEVSTSTDDSTGRVCLRNFSTSTKPIIGQSDGKTFRIENIFHEPRVVTRNTPKIEIIDDSSEDVATNSLIVTNSVGTSFVPETRENATGMEAPKSYNSEICLGIAAKRSLPNMTNTWPSKWTSCLSDNPRKEDYQDYSTRVEDKRSLSDISINELRARRGMDDDMYQKAEPLPESNRQSLDDDIGLRKDATSVTNHEFPKTSREEPKDCSVMGLKSPSIIAMLDRQANGEQETNFSDDSLDLMEDRISSTYGKNESITEASSSNLKDDVSSEKVCPPDLVAHTKKDTIESSISLDHFDEFDDEEQHVELPKTKVDSIAATSFPTPMSSFKTLILGDPSCALHHANDSYLTDFRDQSSADTLIDHEDYLRTTIDVVEDMEQCLVNGGCSVAPRSIIKKSARNINGSRLTGTCQSDCGTKNLRNESSRTKKVRFAMPVVSSMTNSDDESCENPTGDKDFAVPGKRNILEEYLDEAVAFMRNMNSMNEYMSATSPSGKCTTKGRNRRREKGKRKNYIEYEGRRISLEDDNSEPVKSDADDDLDFNVESYDKCLRSMDRLEECLARVKRHDEILRHKYGTGKDGSTGAKLDLAKFSVDPSDADGDPNDGRNLNDAGLRINVNDNNVSTKTDDVDDGNNNPLPWAKKGDFSPEHSLTISDNLKKLRARRFSRFSELRKRNPATYSQLRNRCVSQAVDSRARKKEDVSCSPTTVESSEADGSEDTIVPDGLQAPNCFLVLPKTTRTDVGPSDRFKGCTSRQRFSLSKYDSSNESSSSNEALASFIESIDNVARSKDKIRYPGSPRAKFLQLLSERRRIVENTRSTGAS